MNFWSDIMCWPFGQHLLTKYTLYFVYKNTVFGYHKGLKTNGGQNIVVKHDLGFETCSLTPNLKNVSYPGLFDEISCHPTSRYGKIHGFIDFEHVFPLLEHFRAPK